MDRVIISNDGYPLTNEWLAFLENLSIEQINGLVRAIGNNVIVSGMTEDDGDLTNGFLIYNNELLPFESSTIGTTIVVVETTTSSGYDTGGTGDFSTILPIWKTRKAKFGDPGDDDVVASFAFSTLSRIHSMVELRDNKMEALVEGGFNMFFDDGIMTAIATGEILDAEILPYFVVWYHEVVLTFPTITGDYLPVINLINGGDYMFGTINVYIQEKTSTTLKLMIFMKHDGFVPSGEYLKEFSVTLIKI